MNICYNEQTEKEARRYIKMKHMETEFVVFCIEELAAECGMPGSDCTVCLQKRQI